jgi:hypothetical protein
MNGNDAKQILLDLLLRAEERYGERAHEVHFTVEENESTNETPAPIDVVFHNPALTEATVRIHAGVDANQRRFQLALEGFHLLSPVPRPEVTFLEEGLSQLFALEETVGLLPSDDPNYRKAHDLCESLENTCGNDIVRRLRERQPYISRITPADILALCPLFPAEDAEALCDRWPYYQ